VDAPGLEPGTRSGL